MAGRKSSNFSVISQTLIPSIIVSWRMGAIWSLKHLCESQVGCEHFHPLHRLDAVDEAVGEAPGESHVALLLFVAGELDLLVDVLRDVAVHLLEGLHERGVIGHALLGLQLERLEGLEDLLLVHVACDGEVGVLGPVVLFVVLPNLG